MSERDSIDALDARLRAIEDQLAIYQVVSAYGPLVDTASARGAAEIWTDDGTYDVGGIRPVMRGRDDIAAMVGGEAHGALVANGCAHMMNLPHVSIDGDRAIAFGYHTLMLHETAASGGDGFRVWRLSASRWELVRDAQGWKVSRRVHRLLDGTEDARQLFRESLEETSVVHASGPRGDE